MGWGRKREEQVGECCVDSTKVLPTLTSLSADKHPRTFQQVFYKPLGLGWCITRVVYEEPNILDSSACQNML